MSKQNMYFITYGSNDFRIAKKHLLKLANNSGLFKESVGFGVKDLPKEFQKKFKAILKFKRGGGYWIWKHEIINNFLNQINYDDIVIYSDAGSTFNIKGKKRLFEYIEMLNDSDYGTFIIDNESQNLEYQWTIKELFEYFQIDKNSKEYSSVQKEATHLIFKKNDHSMSFLQKYKEVLDYDPWLITDKYNHKKQSKSFIENRWDQSIFSLLGKTLGCVSIENETHFKLKPEEQYDYPFLAVRRHGHGLKDSAKFIINYKKQYDEPAYFEDKNNV